MIDDDKAASKSRPVETTEGAMDEYKARQKAERVMMVRLRAPDEPKTKRKPGGKAKR